MARNGRRALPKYLELHPLNHVFYYKHPGMPRKANLGKTHIPPFNSPKL